MSSDTPILIISQHQEIVELMERKKQVIQFLKKDAERLQAEADKEHTQFWESMKSILKSKNMPVPDVMGIRDGVLYKIVKKQDSESLMDLIKDIFK